MYPTETDRKTTTSMTVEMKVDRVIELFLDRFEVLLIPSNALAAATAPAEESISRACFIGVNQLYLNETLFTSLAILSVSK